MLSVHGQSVAQQLPLQQNYRSNNASSMSLDIWLFLTDCLATLQGTMKSLRLGDTHMSQ